MQILRFGILSTGNIATQFAKGINAGTTRSVASAVGSRSLDSAKAFADTHRIPAAHGSYDDLINDPTVDAVYNALPNLHHKEWTLKALAAGKHVLCEKPMGMNSAEAREMFAAARSSGKLLVEAFMYRTHPQTQAVLQAVRDGKIGNVKTLRATFCYRTSKIQGNTRFDRSLGGGAAMDIGCYCLDLFRQVTGEMPAPGGIHAFGRLVDSTDGGKIDVSASAVLQYPSGITATMTCAMDTQASNLAQICGDEGYIEVPVPWKPGIDEPTWMLRTMPKPKQDGKGAGTGESVQTFTNAAGKTMYGLEADAFAESVLDGVPPFMPEADSIALAEVLDEVRRQIGLDW